MSSHPLCPAIGSGSELRNFGVIFLILFNNTVIGESQSAQYWVLLTFKFIFLPKSFFLDNPDVNNQLECFKLSLQRPFLLWFVLQLPRVASRIYIPTKMIFFWTILISIINQNVYSYLYRDPSSSGLFSNSPGLPLEFIFLPKLFFLTILISIINQNV